MIVPLIDIAGKDKADKFKNFRVKLFSSEFKIGELIMKTLLFLIQLFVVYQLTISLSKLNK
tara:strand:- start:378 stop:560 length:183 start_codon:yes stop_codon:yes gene_type:complete